MERVAFFVIFAICILQSCVETIAIKISQKQSPEPLTWWQEGIIYQVYPRSHQDSDGDGIGDLAGIESRLDHFVELGISAVWISPIYKSPMKDFGYDISNFTAIEPVFGNMTNFISLSEALKAKDIKLIMDFVPNHSSNEHEWFQMSIQRIEPYSDYYVWKNANGTDEEGNPIPPNNWVSVFAGSVWEWNQERKQFYYHHFLKEQPDLNFENPLVLKEMLAAVKFWLDMGVDGFRVDAVPHLFEDQLFLDEPEDPDRPPESLPDEYRYYLHPYTYNLPACRDTLGEFRELIDNHSLADGKERCMMVEAGVSTLDDLFEYYGNASRPIAHFPFNFEFIKRVKPGFNGSHILEVVDEWLTKMPEGNTANWLVGNHDQRRIAERFGDHAVDPFNMIVHLLPGSSVTYYGEEIGMQGVDISWEDTQDPFGCQAGPDRYEVFTRDPERTPMQWDGTKNSGFSSGNNTWLPISTNYTVVNVALQQGGEETHLEIYKKIVRMRKSDVWRYGSLEAKAPNDGGVFGFARVYNGVGFVVLANLGDSELAVNTVAEFDDIPATVMVYARSMSFLPVTTVVGDRISADNIVIGSGHSLILDF